LVLVLDFFLDFFFGFGFGGMSRAIFIRTS
jgi:hypothetical protein